MKNAIRRLSLAAVARPSLAWTKISIEYYTPRFSPATHVTRGFLPLAVHVES